MNFNDVKELIFIIDNSSIMSISLQMDNLSISIDRNQSGGNPFATANAAPKTAAEIQTPAIEKNLKAAAKATAAAETHTQVMPEITPTTAAASTAPTKEAESGHIIRSQIVGTFYESPSPDKPAFVKVGDAVKVGDVLCILEAMKIMNEMVSDKDGIITEIFVKNGDMIEAQMPLFRII